MHEYNMVTMVTAFTPYKLFTNVKTYLSVKVFYALNVIRTTKVSFFYKEDFAIIFLSSVDKWVR